MSQTEGTRAGEFLVSEGNGQYSRDTVTLISGQDLEAGAVLGKITASGKYTAYNSGAADGSETAAAVLYAKTDASAGDTDAVVVSRHAEVSTELLDGSDADALDDLAAIGIIAR
jgi:hypothetical protein